MIDKPGPAEDFGIASSCAALAGTPAGTIAATVAPLTMADLDRIAAATRARSVERYAVDAEARADAWQSVAIKAATRAHDMHVAAGEYPTYFTWHDCHHPACRAFRADALNTTPPEIQS